ncbi:MAG: alpha/beta hydrolase [Planctomycetaceae bacterium]|nr:alpha/beta hydrolase [Planctomycetaceae bacterium]
MDSTPRPGPVVRTALIVILSIAVGQQAKAQQKRQAAGLTAAGQTKREVVYKEVDGRKLHLDLFYPTDKLRTSACPIIVYTHGGGWAAGSKQGVSRGSFADVFNGLLQHGVAVAAVQYRLCKKGTDITMRDCVIDCKDAVRFLAANSESLKLDPQQCFVMGDSAGGHIAQMLLLSSPETLPGDQALAAVRYRMRAGISWYGPCDFENTQLFNHDDRANFKDRFAGRILGTTQEGKRQRYREVSPINYLDEQDAPLLMIQGDRDTTIPVKHAFYMLEKAAAVRAPVEVVIVKHAGHNWRKVEQAISPTRAEIVDRTVRFVTERLPSHTRKPILNQENP